MRQITKRWAGVLVGENGDAYVSLFYTRDEAEAWKANCASLVVVLDLQRVLDEAEGARG